MIEQEVKSILVNKLNFSRNSLNKLDVFTNHLLKANKNRNLIAKSTEKSIWFRHILDSAQILRFIDFHEVKSIVDLGTGAGFPGLVLAIFCGKVKFHVKLFEKSPVKRLFLRDISSKLNLNNLTIYENIYNIKKDLADLVVCRAFKKLPEIINISREKIKKPHKLIILKGKNAQSEINNLSLEHDYSYKLEKSLTDNDSKIIIIKAK